MKFLRTIASILAACALAAALGVFGMGTASAEGGEMGEAETCLQVTENENNRFTLTVSHLNLTGGHLAGVRFAVWSAEGGQDDLAWYIARQTDDGSWSASGTMAEHDYASGAYCVHIYSYHDSEEPVLEWDAMVELEGSRPDWSSQIDPSRPMVALTFDDGPYSPVTLRILDALEAVNGRATFFVVGNRVAGCASVVRRANAMGCQIGNHTWDHTPLTNLPAAEIVRELEQCAGAVDEVIGRPPQMVRPVGGMVNSTVYAAVEEPMILWSIDTEDWCTQNAEKTYDAVIGHVRDGDIVLMHDLYPSTADAAEKIIPELVRQGYQLVTVEELAIYRGYTPGGHTTYSQFR